MTVRETDLPGIGRKYQLTTRGGDQLIIVIHDDGRRECFRTDPRNSDENESVMTLDDDEARLVAGIIGGMTYKPKALESIEMALDDLVIEWYRIDAECACIGKTIGELNVRQTSGATIIAVVGKPAKQLNPGPDVVIAVDSTLIVAGERGQHRRFKQILTNGR